LRKSRAFVLAFAEYVELLAHPPILVNEVWRCKYTKLTPMCSKSGEEITGAYVTNGPYTCLECNKTYFECRTCYQNRYNEFGGDHESVCNKCEKYILVCRDCVDKLYTSKSKHIRDIYECCLCMRDICPEHTVPRECMDCGTSVRICQEHAFLLANHVRCNSCMQHHVM
jgi:hypothetical protein